jgi:hypothetical protein
MDPDRDTLAAFVDGELPPKEMERIAALLAARPDLERYVRQQEDLRAKLRKTYALTTSVPERLIRAVHNAPASWPYRLRAWLAPRFSLGALAWAGAALAMGVVIGVVVRPTGDLGTDAAGQLIARNSLAKVLSTQLAAAGYDGVGPRIGISFRNKAGSDCRTFTNGDNAGFACRQDGAWVIGMLARQTREYPRAAYRMAGSEMPDAVRRAVEESINGAPFDAATEKRARDRGWSGR